MTCTHRLGGQADGLVCDREVAHDPDAAGGHSYTSAAGPDLEIKHHPATGDDQ